MRAAHGNFLSRLAEHNKLKSRYIRSRLRTGKHSYFQLTICDKQEPDETTASGQDASHEWNERGVVTLATGVQPILSLRFFPDGQKSFGAFPPVLISRGI